MKTIQDKFTEAEANPDRISFLQELVVAWADSKMPNRKPQAALLKFTEELGELIRDPSSPGEYADLLIMLLDLCHMHGVDLHRAVLDKMAINMRRDWKHLPSGVMQHVEENDNWTEDVTNLLNSMLHYDFRYDVSPAFRDEARRLLGMKSPVES